MKEAEYQNTHDTPLGSPYYGEIVHWNDAKGYGFIRMSKEQPNIFFHISNYAYHHRRPKKGETVAFLLNQNNHLKPTASRVVVQGHEDTLYQSDAHDQHTTKPYLAEAVIYTFLDILFYTILASISIPIALASLIISVLTFMLYSLDKHASLKNSQRVPEASLHIAALLGGWPGALIARPLLRHKTSKNRFIIFFWLSVIINFFSLYAMTWYIINPNY